MSIPANAGPTMRVIFIPELLREKAFIRLVSGTMSEIIACRLGIVKANKVPLTTPMAMRCQNAMMPVMSRVASRRVIKALPHWLNMIMCFLGMRSARAPLIRDINVRGVAKATITQDRASGESSVSLRTNQPLVIICMFMAKKEREELIHNHRKSLLCREAKMLSRVVDFRESFIP